MIQIPLTPDQYIKALSALMAAKSPDVDSLSLPVNGKPGQLVNSQVTLSFSYNGSNSLDIKVLEKHGLARFASDSTIQSHLVDLLQKQA